MKRFLIIAVNTVLFGASATSADVWRWNDNFIATFVDAEGINRHPVSSYLGEKFTGQMTGTLDVPRPGVDVYYHLVDAGGNPVGNSVAGLEAWKPDGADWLGQGPTSGLGPVWQWGKQLHMDATAFESLVIPLWYIGGAGPLDVRAFCVTGTAGSSWVETQMDSSTVTLNQGDSATLTVDITVAPDPTRLVKVGVVVEAPDSIMVGGQYGTRPGGYCTNIPVFFTKHCPRSDYRSICGVAAGSLESELAMPWMFSATFASFGPATENGI